MTQNPSRCMVRLRSRGNLSLPELDLRAFVTLTVLSSR